jgi:uncharacterized protein YkwD
MIFMNRKLKYIVIVFMLLFASVTIVYGDSTISYLTPYPKDISMLITKPEIGIKLQLNGNEIESIEMKLDGQIVGAKYESDSQSITYQTNSPLAEGKHIVDLVVKIKGWSTVLSESWAFTVGSNAVNSLPSATEDQKYALNFVNNLRNSLNMPTVTLDDSLNAAAKAHTRYMISNQRVTHDELPGNKDYTGVSPMVRARAFGYNGLTVEENAASGFTKIDDILNSSLDAPYQRLNWINPYVDHIGYYGQDRYFTVLFGAKMQGEAKVVTYPYNNQKGVPITWKNTGSPNPLEGINDNSIGYPITVSYLNEKEINSLNIISTSLKDSSGTTVYTYNKEPKNDKNLNNSIIIIPKNPLKDNTKYNLQFKFEVILKDGKKETIDRTLSFTTVNNRVYAYKDIENHWAVEIIDQLAQRRISITSGTNFYPDRDITRGEFAKLISDMLDLTKYAVRETFNDVTTNTSFAKEIEAVARHGYIKGYEDGSFRANNNISRQEMAVIIKRVYDKKVSSKYDIKDYTLSYTDKDAIQSWSEESIKLCSKTGIIKGRENGQFSPYDFATRAEGYVIISRMLTAMR